MTDYIAITDTQVDPDAPLTSQLGYQFRNNPIAIAEGSVGAPPIEMQALGRFTAGTEQRYLDSVGDTTTATSYPPLTNPAGRALSIYLGGSGVIRLTFDQSGTSTDCRVLVNEVQQVTYSGAGSRSADITLPVGAWLVLQHRSPTGAGSFISNIQLLTNGEPIMAVASQQFVVFA